MPVRSERCLRLDLTYNGRPTGSMGVEVVDPQGIVTSYRFLPDDSNVGVLYLELDRKKIVDAGVARPNGTPNGLPIYVRMELTSPEPKPCP